MDFAKYKSVKAAPPADAGIRNTGPSPIMPMLKEAANDGEWHAFMGVGTEIVGQVSRKADGAKVDVKEYQELSGEIKKCARQLDKGLSIRVKFSDDGKTADVYYRLGDKRKYERQNDKADGKAAKK